MADSGTQTEYYAGESAIKKSLKPIMLVEAALGINRWTNFNLYNFVLRSLFKLYSVVAIFAVIGFYFLTYQYSYRSLFIQWYCIFMGTQCAVVIFVAVFMYKKPFDKLIEDIGQLDESLEVPFDSEANKVVRRQVVICMTVWWTASLYDILTNNDRHIFSYIAVRMTRNMIDLDVMLLSLMFHVIHVRVTIIRKYLESPEDPKTRKGILGKLWTILEKPLMLENTLLKITTGRSLSLDKLIKCYERTVNGSILLNECSAAGLLVSLSIQLPRTIIILCKLIVAYILKQDTIEAFSKEVLVPAVTKTTLLSFIPSIIADLTGGEIKKMKTLLSKRRIRDDYAQHRLLRLTGYSMMVCASFFTQVVFPDKREEDDVKTFLTLLEVRPVSYSLYWLLSLDLSLPIDYIKLLCTYVIIILQFTHVKGPA